MFQLRPQGSIPLCRTRIHRVLGRHTLVIALYIVLIQIRHAKRVCPALNPQRGQDPLPRAP